MFRLTNFLAGTLTLAILSGCASITAQTDYDRQADFSNMRSFAWMTDPPVIVPPDQDMPISALNLRRIKESIELELTGKGFTQVPDRDAADFVISATVGARDHIDLALYPVPYRRAWMWHSRFYGNGLDAVGVENYTEGTLAIDVFDQRTKEAVWHGWATKRITNADIEDASEPIRLAVDAILGDFPPQAGQ
jgi:Domain of unknown function (DUF4136)